MNIQKGVNPKRILMLTFDNAAVNSIHYKMHEQLDGVQKDISQPEIKTLNSFGYSILRENFPNDYKNIIPDYRQRRLFEEVKEGLAKKAEISMTHFLQTYTPIITWSFLVY